MANIRKRFGKWQCQIRRTFHKPIIKTLNINALSTLIIINHVLK